MAPRLYLVLHDGASRCRAGLKPARADPDGRTRTAGAHLKLSNFPENRLQLVNTALADFFKGNGLSVCQITGDRARRLKKWFAECNSGRRWAHTAPLSAEHHRVRVRWMYFKYDHPSSTRINRDICTAQNLDALGAHRLPTSIATEVAAISQVSVYVYNHWDYKSFFFRV